jgi:hypothetical protein
MTFLTVDEFDGLFETFEYTAFRLQVASFYPHAPEDAENFPRWQAGLPLRVNSDGWLDLIRTHTDAGRVMSRVRVMGEALTDLDRYSVAMHKATVDAGEDVRYIARDQAPRLPEHDFWLFDSHRMCRLHHHLDRRTDFEPITSAAEIVEANRLRDELLHHAVPYEEFVANLTG